MDRVRILVVVTLMVGLGSIAALGQDSNTVQPAKPEVPVPMAVPRQALNPLLVNPAPMDPERQVKDLQVLIDRFSAEHKVLMDELEAIAESARKEKAKQTSAKVKALIEKRKQESATRLHELQQQLDRSRQMAERLKARQGPGNLAGRKAPPFDLKGYDGKNYRLSDYKGKVVVLEWIDPASPFVQYMYEKKITTALAAKFKDKGVVWLAINSSVQATPQQNQQFIDRYKLSYPILVDAVGRVRQSYGAKTAPHLFVIDKKGTVVYSGAIDDSPLGQKRGTMVNFVEQALSEVLEGKPVSIPYKDPYGMAPRSR